jgi:hypothetical protein
VGAFAHIKRKREMKENFLSLKPAEGVRYSVFTLTVCGQLRKHGDTHGAAIWVDHRGRVWADEGVLEENTYYGLRTNPEELE